MAAIAGARTMPAKPKQAKRAAELDHTALQSGVGVRGGCARLDVGGEREG